MTARPLIDKSATSVERWDPHLAKQIILYLNFNLRKMITNLRVQRRRLNHWSKIFQDGWDHNPLIWDDWTFIKWSLERV
jgi:hypothetical protein